MSISAMGQHLITLAMTVKQTYFGEMEAHNKLWKMHTDGEHTYKNIGAKSSLYLVQ